MSGCGYRISLSKSSSRMSQTNCNGSRVGTKERICKMNTNCDSCNYCDYCNSCNSCNYCYYCNSCDSCKNLRMTEYNLFCYSKNYNDDQSFQQKRYKAFNKEVGRERYNEILKQVNDILGSSKLKLTDFWEQVTQEQWKKLLSIPEAHDFKEGFEYISGQKITSGN